MASPAKACELEPNAQEFSSPRGDIDHPIDDGVLYTPQPERPVAPEDRPAPHSAFADMTRNRLSKTLSVFQNQASTSSPPPPNPRSARASVDDQREGLLPTLEAEWLSTSQNSARPKIYSQRSGMNRALYAHKTALRLKQHLDHMSLRVSIFNNQEGELGENSWLEDGAGGPTSPEDLASHPGTSGDSRQTSSGSSSPEATTVTAVPSRAAAPGTAAPDPPLLVHLKEVESLGKVSDDESATTPNLFNSTIFSRKETSPNSPNAYASDSKYTGFLISPNSNFRIGWDSCQAIFLIYIAFIVPFRVSFNQPSMGIAFWLESMMDVYFIVDLGLNFITGYEDDDTGTEVMEFKFICRNYLQRYFFMDVVACFPVDMMLRLLEGVFWCSFKLPSGCDAVTQQDALTLLRMLRLLRLVKVFKLISFGPLKQVLRNINMTDDGVFTMDTFIKVCKYLGPLLYLGHLFGCFFFYFSGDNFRTDDERLAIERGDIVPWTEEFFFCTEGVCNAVRGKGLEMDKYIASLYWAFTTMTTVGYGDIRAVTRMERLFACLGMLMGGFAFAIIFSGMADALTSMDIVAQKRARKLELLKTFLKRHAPPITTRREVCDFFYSQTALPINNAELLEELPYNLRLKLMFHLYSTIVVLVPFLRESGENGGQDIPFSLAFCARLREQTMVKGHIVFEQGEPVPSTMFIIADGLVQLFKRAEGEVASALSSGQHFGEGWLFGDNKRRETAVCTTVVMLLKCEKSDIEEILRVNEKPMRILHAEYARRMQEWHGVTVQPLSSLNATHSTETGNAARRLFADDASAATAAATARISPDQVFALSNRIQALELGSRKTHSLLEELVSQVKALREGPAATSPKLHDTAPW